MEYVNDEILTQETVCNLEFTLFRMRQHNQVQVGPMCNDPGTAPDNSISICLAKSFLDRAIPGRLTMRILVNLDGL